MEIKTESNQIYSPIRDKWLVLKPEEEVRQRYVCRLVDSYGYGIKQMGEEVKVTNSQRGQGAARADIVVWRNEEDKRKGKNALIVVECKAENVTIRQADYFQGYNYAAWAGAKFFVTTNLKETRIFKVVEDAMPKKLEEIADIPSADMVNDDKKIKAMLLQTKAFTRDEFSRLLFKCHNIIRNNDKLSPEAAFDEISKILFIKIRYERTNSGTQIFSKEEFLKQKKMYDAVKSKESPDYYQFLFNKTKEDFAKDHLFDENETIKIRENSFEQIVKELQVYNLSTTSDDVKGIAFEQFLGRTFRGELGQFFTPRTIVDFMVSVLDPQEGEYVCDPCCGSGGFLIRAFEYVREHIENEVEVRKEDVKKSLFTDDYSKLPKKEQEKNDQKVIDAFSKMNYELDINNPMGRLRSLSFDCIYGTDANPRMARTAKMNMIMHGDGHGGVHHHDGLLNVNGIWEGRFDVILTNPPFGARIDKELKITEADRFTDIEKIKAYEKRYGKENYDNALKQVNDHINQPILDLFQIGKFSGLTEVLFIERCLNPVKPSLLFFKKFTEDEAEEYNRICIQVSHEVEAKYDEEMTDIDVKLAKRGKEALTKDEKKSLRSRKKELTVLIENEIKALVKERFDYVIPIAEVQKAGISTTGAKIENELEPLEKEFTEYRKENKLWEKHVKATKYSVSEDGTMLRTRFIDGVACEPEPFYRY